MTKNGQTKQMALIRVYSKFNGTSIEGWWDVIDGKIPKDVLLLMKVYDGLEIKQIVKNDNT